jgi:hypothetical protein
MNVKKSSYVPPAFRKDNLQDKLSRVDNILKKEEEEIKIINQVKEKEKEKTKEELFPSLNSHKNIQNTQTSPKVQLGAWGKKLVIEKPEEPKEEPKQEEKKEVNTLTTTIATTTSTKEEEWGESAWETMEDY